MSVQYDDERPRMPRIESIYIYSDPTIREYSKEILDRGGILIRTTSNAAHNIAHNTLSQMLF